MVKLTRGVTLLHVYFTDIELWFKVTEVTESNRGLQNRIESFQKKEIVLESNRQLLNR